jgi:hypothetical protein
MAGGTGKCGARTGAIAARETGGHIANTRTLSNQMGKFGDHHPINIDPMMKQRYHKLY